MNTKADQTLKLHMDDGDRVWFADGDRVPVDSGLPVSSFIKALRHRGPSVFRVLGLAVNAPLLIALYRTFQRGGRIEVASPLACETSDECSYPPVALYRMRECGLAPSQGGWHEFTADDYPSYALAARFQRDPCFDEEVQQILKLHPVWSAATFIGSIQPEYLARVLAVVLDPRWYIDPRNPSRISRLFTYMGVTPAGIRAVVRGSQGVKASRCRAVLAAWDWRNPEQENLPDPCQFLWRTYFAAGGGERGLLRASQRFLAYLRHTWMQELYRDTRYGRLELFVPDMLFKDAGERAGYLSHNSGPPSV